MRRSWITVAIVLSALVAACTASPSETDTTTTTVTESDTLPGETSTTAAIDDEIVDGVPNDIVAFVSDLAVLLKDSPFADALEEDPEVFIATAKLLCERLAADVPPFEVLSGYLESLTDDSLGDAPDEVIDLAGWMFGEAVGSFCPEYSDRLEGFES